MSDVTRSHNGGKTVAAGAKPQRLARGSIPMTERPREVSSYTEVDAAGKKIRVSVLKDGREIEISNLEHWYTIIGGAAIMVFIAVWIGAVIVGLFQGDDSGHDNVYVPRDSGSVGYDMDRRPTCRERFNTLQASVDRFSFREYTGILRAIESDCGPM